MRKVLDIFMPASTILTYRQPSSFAVLNKTAANFNDIYWMFKLPTLLHVPFQRLAALKLLYIDKEGEHNGKVFTKLKPVIC